MRAGLVMRVIGMLVLTVLLVLGARSCLGGGGQSGPALNSLLRQGVGGACADAASVNSADDSAAASPSTLVPASQASSLTGVAQLAGGGTGTFSCPTTTSTP